MSYEVIVSGVRTDHDAHTLCGGWIVNNRTSGIVSLLLLFSAGQAVADSGKYEMVYAFVTTYISIPHAAGTVTAGGNRGSVTVIDSTDSLFAKGQSSAQECVVFGTRSSKGLDFVSECTMTDSGGDKVFHHAVRKTGDVSQGNAVGVNDIVGGTGKYEGIRGHCTYTVQLLPESRGVSTVTCDWQKP